MTSRCPRCSTQLDSAVQGLCPRCLLDLALSEPDAADDSRFRIVTLLGRGAHGTTYLAEQDEEPRFVSLKILDETSAGAARRSLEAVRQALIDARHPSLVQVVSVKADEAPAVAAAYVQGRKVTRGAGSPDPAVLSGLTGIASAIAYLHGRSLVHGNIHASNVLALPPSGDRTSPSTGLRAGQWCLIDLAAARPLASPADAAVDLVAFGRFMRDMLGGPPDGSQRPLDRAAAIAERAVGGGYTIASDLVRDLSGLVDGR